ALRVLEPDHPVRIVAPGLVAVAVRAVVARLLAAGHRRLAHRLELLPALVGVVGLALGHQPFGDLAVAVQALGLEDRAFVIVQPQPVHRLEDRVDRGLGAALAVGVLDPQDELAPRVPRPPPARQRGAPATDVQVAGGTGGEAGTTGHGRTIGRSTAFYPCPARPAPARPVTAAALARKPTNQARPRCHAVPGGQIQCASTGLSTASVDNFDG